MYKSLCLKRCAILEICGPIQNILKNLTSDDATSVKRLPNFVQTLWTFGQRWLDVVQISRVHWVNIGADRSERNRVDPGLSASQAAVCSGFALFAILSISFDLITSLKIKMFKF